MSNLYDRLKDYKKERIKKKLQQQMNNPLTLDNPERKVTMCVQHLERCSENELITILSKALRNKPQIQSIFTEVTTRISLLKAVETKEAEESKLRQEQVQQEKLQEPYRVSEAYYDSKYGHPEELQIYEQMTAQQLGKILETVLENDPHPRHTEIRLEVVSYLQRQITIKNSQKK